MTQTLPKLPSAKTLYAKALTTAGRKPGKSPKIPHLDVKVSGVVADTKRLAAYRDLCGFETTDFLPITFPQVQAAPLHMWLMLQPQFPIPLMGIVHIRNVFDTLRPMPVDGTYEVRAALTDGRRTHQGLEFDILTEYTDEAGEIVHRSLMTPLFRMKSETAAPPKGKPKAAPSGLAEYRTFDIPADMGRQYAPVGGDFNPIHLHPLTAKAFGFPRAIAHGMWSVAKTAALLEGARGGAAASHLEVQFRQPLFLPGKVSLKFNGPGAEMEFALLSRTSDKTHLTGSLI